MAFDSFEVENWAEREEGENKGSHDTDPRETELSGKQDVPRTEYDLPVIADSDPALTAADHVHSAEEKWDEWETDSFDSCHFVLP